MSAEAIRATTLAIQRLLHTAVGLRNAATGALEGSPDESVFIGPPVRGADGVGSRPVSLFLFHLVPNGELRNAPRYVTAADDGAPADDPDERDALVLDARYLISVHRPVGVAEPNELSRLGQVLAALQARPTLSGALLPGQEVRLSPEPYPMEEMSRIWGLFPNEAYRTSVVYLATPIFVDARDVLRGEPVASRRVDAGVSAEPPALFRDHRERQRGTGP